MTPESPTLTVPDTEAALIGAMMIDNRLVDQASDRLLPDHFSNAIYRRVYKTMQFLRAHDEVANPITLRGYFPAGSVRDDRGDEIDVGKALVNLAANGAALVGASSFVDQIIEFAVRRQMRAALLAGVEDLEAVARPFSIDGEAPAPLTIAADTAAGLMAAVEARNPNKLVGMGTLLGRVRARYNRAAAGESIGATCRTIAELNEILGPVAPQQMTVIGGRSGMGKTILACSAAWGYAVNNHPTLLISLEMSDDTLAMRMAADLTFGMDEPVPYRDMVRNQTNESQLLTVDEAARRIAEYPLTTVCPGRVTIEQIAGIVGREHARLTRLNQKLEVVVVDYVQIVAATGKLDGKARIDHISEGLLGIAKRYDCHVFALSQLLRDIDKRPDRRPTVADLKESGRLEEDADNVLLVYRPEFYLIKEQPKKEDEAKWNEWNIEMETNRGLVDLMGVKSRSNEPMTKAAKFFGANQAIRSREFFPSDFMSDDTDLLLPKMKRAA
jgi:replicative DNA helicase